MKNELKLFLGNINSKVKFYAIRRIDEKTTIVGFYNFKLDKISLSYFSEEETFFHELCHAYFNKKENHLSDKEEELICRMVGEIMDGFSGTSEDLYIKVLTDFGPYHPFYEGEIVKENIISSWETLMKECEEFYTKSGFFSLLRIKMKNSLLMLKKEFLKSLFCLIKEV